MSIVLSLVLVKTSQRELCEGGPSSKQSFRLTRSLSGLTEVSETIFTLPVSADSHS